jgi:hypothetical protein
MKNEKSENNCKHGWKYHLKKPISFLVILPACLLFIDFILDWILYFKSYLFISFIALVSPAVLLPICIITALYQLIKKNIRNFAFLILPLVIIGLFFAIPNLGNDITRLRYQTELVIQEYLYIPEIANISDGKRPEITYKEWSIPSGMPNRDFWIVYDVTDKIAAKNGLKISDGSYSDELSVDHIEGHFYMMSMFYPGKIWY